MASKKGNILIVDDNAGIRQALKILLPMHFAEVEVVLFTAYADIALAVEGMKRGAFDFIVKPWDNEKLVATLIAARDKARKLWAGMPRRKDRALAFRWPDRLCGSIMALSTWCGVM